MWIKRELTQPVSHVILFSSAGAFKARSGAEWAKQLLPPHRSECLSSLQPHAWRPPGPLHRYTLYGYFWIIYIFILLVSVQSQTHFIVFNGYLTEISFMAITLIIYSVILYRDSISMSHPLWVCYTLFFFLLVPLLHLLGSTNNEFSRMLQAAGPLSTSTAPVALIGKGLIFAFGADSLKNSVNKDCSPHIEYLIPSSLGFEAMTSALSRPLLPRIHFLISILSFPLARQSLMFLEELL